MYRLNNKGKIQYIDFKNFYASLSFEYGFCTRNGGLSLNEFSSLNMHFSVGDDQNTVLKNRRLLLETLNTKINDIVSLNQVHSDKVVILKDIKDIKNIKNSKADAIITDLKNVPVGILTADCLPLILFSKKTSTMALVHAGREGVFEEIAKKTLDRLLNFKETSPDEITAFVGPGVGKCCYGISKTLFDRAKEKLDFHDDVIEKRDNILFLDLKKSLILQLRQVGIKERNIFSVDLCTACNTDLFFSYRKEHGKTGRMITFGMLK